MSHDKDKNRNTHNAKRKANLCISRSRNQRTQIDNMKRDFSGEVGTAKRTHGSEVGKFPLE